jgi:hypothetical protein
MASYPLTQQRELHVREKVLVGRTPGAPGPSEIFERRAAAPCSREYEG